MLNLRLIQNWLSTESDDLSKFVFQSPFLHPSSTSADYMSYLIGCAYREGVILALKCVLEEAKHAEHQESTCITPYARRLIEERVERSFTSRCTIIPKEV